MARGKVRFEAGDAGDGLYGILAGHIAFTMDSADGRELILNVLGPGEFFGEIALLDGKGRSATAVARDAGQLLFMPRSQFLPFVRERPDMRLHILALVCGHLRRSTDYIAARCSSGWRSGSPSRWRCWLRCRSGRRARDAGAGDDAVSSADTAHSRIAGAAACVTSFTRPSTAGSGERHGTTRWPSTITLRHLALSLAM